MQAPGSWVTTGFHLPDRPARIGTGHGRMVNFGGFVPDGGTL
jgi:hypothetical protein